MAIPQGIYSVVAAKVTEPTFLILPHDMGVLVPEALRVLAKPLSNYDILLIGPGLGREPITGDFMRALLTGETHRGTKPVGFTSQPALKERPQLPPLVLDADGLNLIADLPNWWDYLPAGSVLTPHPGEMARLLHCSVQEIAADRIGVARNAAKTWGCAVILKGAYTVVASADGQIRFESVGESVISEPKLENPSVNLTDLMAYSLHRNLVRNSINAAELALKRYRKEDVPVVLEPGDLVFLYSDGIDDIFMPSELLAMVKGRKLGEAFEGLLLNSERRMKYVSGQLLAQRKKLADGHQRKAYPLVHERLNRERIREGCYLESYYDGEEGRWLKPPKCDNLSICALYVSSMPADF